MLCIFASPYKKQTKRFNSLPIDYRGPISVATEPYRWCFEELPIITVTFVCSVIAQNDSAFDWVANSVKR